MASAVVEKSTLPNLLWGGEQLSCAGGPLFLGSVVSEGQVPTRGWSP